ncbi:MAG: symporter small accessory protein [Candidatus Riflemargulisbacteria bacterium]
MLGIKDPLIYLAYILSILSALLCVVYGLANWNKGAEKEEEEIAEEQTWEKKEQEINKSL